MRNPYSVFSQTFYLSRWHLNKSLILFLILQFILIHQNKIFAQNITIAHHDINDNSGNIIKIGSQSFYFKNLQGESCCFKKAKVVCINQQGQVVFEKQMNPAV